MGGECEDRREAARLTTNLSSYVMSAALAVLGGQVAILTVFYEHLTHLSRFVVVAGLACTFSVLSIVLGGKGISEICRNGFEGNWEITTLRGYFNWQAILCLVSIGLVIWSTFLGTPRSDSWVGVREIETLQANVEAIQCEYDALELLLDETGESISAHASLAEHAAPSGEEKNAPRIKKR